MTYLFEKFELDVENFSLSRDGERLSLEPRSLQVLSLLIENPGKLLDKSFILETVWVGTFVEESTLTRAVALIRKRLGDDPRKPQFIETVPTRGYRFIAPVTLAPEARTQPAAEMDVPVTLSGEEVSDRVKPDAPENFGRSPSRRGHTRWFLPAALVLIVAGISAWWLHARRRPMVGPGDTIVLADFSNTTGDPVLDDTLRRGLAVQLEQSPVLRLLPEARAKATLRLMGLPADTPLTTKLAEDVCQRTGSSVVLSGSVVRNGSRYALGVEAIRCLSSDVVLRTQVQVERKEDLLDALSGMATHLRERMGESRRSIHELDQPLAEATTPSLEALKVYSTGMQVLSVEGSAAALPVLRRAIEIDPDFALAHSEIGRIYADLGEEELSLKSAAEAYRLRSRSSLRERFFIEATYQLQVLGNVEKAEELCLSWQTLYPSDIGASGFLAGIVYRIAGRYEDALRQAQRTVDTSPSFGMGHHLLAISQIRLGRLAEAEQALRRATELGLTMPEFQMDVYRVAFLRNDQSAMQRATSSAEGHSGVRSMIMNQTAATLAYEGRLREANSVSDAAIELAKQSGKSGMAANFEASAALRNAFEGEAKEARVRAQTAMSLSRSRDAEFGAAFAYALIGDQKIAESLAGDLATRFPEDTVVRYQYVPCILGLDAIQRGQPERALELMKGSERFDLGFPQNAAVGTFGALYAPYVRGRAYLGLHRDAEARQAFQLIVSHPGITLNDPIGATARRQLASL